MARIRRQKYAVIGVLLAILLVCESASLAVLFSRMSGFSEETYLGDIIPLTQPDVRTNITVRQQSAAGAPAGELVTVQGGEAAFAAYDENTVWSAETEVEIFRLSYDNENGDITVKNAAGRNDALIAPGTSNEYMFTLENTGDVPLDYTMDMEARIGGTELLIPVKARVRDHTNEYLLGSPALYEDVTELDSVRDEGVLGAGRFAAYTLEWEWPFEQEIDEYDTMLGNLAVDDDLTLTIKINTTAMYDRDSDDPKISESGISSPKTGDNMPLGALVTAAIALLAAFAALPTGRRHKDEEHEQTEE